jgi:hypothetical protein
MFVSPTASKAASFVELCLCLLLSSVCGEPISLIRHYKESGLLQQKKLSQ